MLRIKSGWTTSTVQLGPRIYHFGKIPLLHFRAQWKIGKTLIACIHHIGLIPVSKIPNLETLMQRQKRMLSNVNTTITVAGNGARTTVIIHKISELAVMLELQHQSKPHNPESA